MAEKMESKLLTAPEMTMPVYVFNPRSPEAEKNISLFVQDWFAALPSGEVWLPSVAIDFDIDGLRNRGLARPIGVPAHVTVARLYCKLSYAKTFIYSFAMTPAAKIKVKWHNGFPPAIGSKTGEVERGTCLMMLYQEVQIYPWEAVSALELTDVENPDVQRLMSLDPTKMKAN